jgi:hypothetical protein
MSSETYTITGDVVGWLKLPHSTWWYGADKCPGARSGGDLSDSGIPGAGSTKDLVRDALDALNTHVKERGEGDGPIFRNQFGERLTKKALSYYWLRKLKELGIVTKANIDVQRYGRGLHNLRDTFRTLWVQSGAKPHIAEAMMGHMAKVDPLGYDQSFKNEDYVRDQLELAAPFLNILTRGEAYGQVDKDDVRRLKKEIEDLKAQLEQRGRQEDRQAEINRQLAEEIQGIKRLLVSPS